MLKNKEGVKLKFKKKNDKEIYVISKKKCLEVKKNGKIIQRGYKENRAEQLWKTGEPNAEGYFTLETVENHKKIMEAVSSSNFCCMTTTNFQITGNIT